MCLLPGLWILWDQFAWQFLPSWRYQGSGSWRSSAPTRWAEQEWTGSCAAFVWQVCLSRRQALAPGSVAAVRTAAGRGPGAARIKMPSPDVPHGDPSCRRGPVATPSARSGAVSTHHTLLSDLHRSEIQISLSFISPIKPLLHWKI